MKSIMEVLKSLKIEPLYDAAAPYTGPFIYKGSETEGRSISIPMCTAALTPTAKKQNNPNVHILNHNKAKNPAIRPSTDGHKGSWFKSNRLGT